MLAEISNQQGNLKSHITSDGIIDDDFETELAGHKMPVRLQ